MRKRCYLIYFLAITLIIFVGYTSCIKDSCASLKCENGGVCVNGVCACPTGYEGEFCGKQWNEKFYGKWYVSDSVVIFKQTSKPVYYDINIAGEQTKDSFYVYGLTDTINTKLLCVRNSARMFNILAGQRPDSFLTIKSGTGIVDSLTGIISGDYVFTRKFKADTTYKDTTMTVKFIWKR